MTLPSTLSAHWIGNNTAYEVRYAPEPVTPQLYMHKEDKDVYGYIRKDAPAPAVFPMADHKVEVTQQWQFFTRGINYNMPIQYVAVLFGARKAFCNRNPDDLRADWLRMRDLNRPNPDFDRVRTCSRSVLAGHVLGDELSVTMLDGSKPPPLRPGRTYPQRVEDINIDDYLYTPLTHRHLFFAANIVTADGRVVPFANGAVYDWFGPRPVTWMPHVARFEVRYPLAKLTPVSDVPSPYRP